MKEGRLKRIISSLRIREFCADIAGQFVFYTTLLCALGAWAYFGTVYAPVTVGIAGFVVFWVVHRAVLGE